MKAAIKGFCFALTIAVILLVIVKLLKIDSSSVDFFIGWVSCIAFFTGSDKIKN